MNNSYLHWKAESLCTLEMNNSSWTHYMLEHGIQSRKQKEVQLEMALEQYHRKGKENQRKSLDVMSILLHMKQ